MSRAILKGNGTGRKTEGRGERREAGRVGETQRRLTQTAHLKAKPSLSLSRNACNPYYEHPGAR
jgi:hypothetical protein